jgi:hypothetical protein
MNQVAQQKAADAKVRSRITTLLGWTEAELFQCEYSQGIVWLDAVFGQADGPDGVNVVRRKLEAAVGFWAWWKNQWANLDSQMEPNLKVVAVADEKMLGYYAPNIGPTYYTRDTWRAFYQRRHQETMSYLRPDDETLGRILRAV